jgi:hypothetical protein
MTDLLVFGTFWFWVVIIAAYLIVGLFVEFGENGVGATITFLVSIFLFYKMGNAYIITSWFKHPVELLLWCLAYIALGVGWTFVKWWLYATKQAEGFKETKAIFMRDFKITDNVIPPGLKDKFKQATKYFPGGYTTIDYELDVSQHKDDIILWMTYWPASALFTTINDPIRRLFVRVYNQIANLLQHIADSVLKEAKADLQ